MDQNEMSNNYRGPSIDASYQISVHLAKQFQRRRFLEIDQSEIRTACDGPIKKRIFVYIVRGENICPQVLGDRIFPPFFQHYEKNIAYRILKLLSTA